MLILKWTPTLRCGMIIPIKHNVSINFYKIKIVYFILLYVNIIIIINNVFLYLSDINQKSFDESSKIANAKKLPLLISAIN